MDGGAAGAVLLASSIISAKASKLPCSDSTILCTKVFILSLRTPSSTKAGVDSSKSVVTALDVADMLRLGLRTGGKFTKSLGEC